MNRTLTKGRISELAYAQRCLELGLSVHEPIGTERYDLVVELGGGPYRVQVKTGQLKNGSIIFNTCSNAEGVGRPVSYDGAADAFGIWSPDLGRAYWMAVAESPRGNGILRVEPTRNNQSQRIRWADAYRLERIVAEVEQDRAATLARSRMDPAEDLEWFAPVQDRDEPEVGGGVLIIDASNGTSRRTSCGPSSPKALSLSARALP